MRKLLQSRGLRMIALVCVVGWILVAGIDSLGGPEEIRATYGLELTWMFVPVQAVVAVSPFPGEVVAIISSAVHGFWLGSFLNWIGWMLAAYLEYSLVRWTAREVDFSEERLPGWLRRFPTDHPAYLIVGRFLPFGSHLVNGTSGVRGLAMWRFTWTSAIALVPGAVLMAALANGLVSL